MFTAIENSKKFIKRSISCSIHITFQKNWNYHYRKYLIHVLLMEGWSSTTKSIKTTQYRMVTFKVIFKAMKITSRQTRHVQHFAIPLCRPTSSCVGLSFLVCDHGAPKPEEGGGVLPGVYCCICIDALLLFVGNSRKRLIWCVADESGMGCSLPILKRKESATGRTSI